MKVLLISLLLVCGTAKATIIDYYVEGEINSVWGDNPITELLGTSISIDFGYDLDTPIDFVQDSRAFYLTGFVNAYFGSDTYFASAYSNTQVYNTPSYSDVHVSAHTTIEHMNYGLSAGSWSNESFLNGYDLPTELNNGDGYGIFRFSAYNTITRSHEWGFSAILKNIGTANNIPVDVPEPTSIALLGLAMGGMLIRRKKAK